MFVIFAPNATLREATFFMQHPPGASADFYQIKRDPAEEKYLNRVVATNQQEGSLKAKVANLLGEFT